ncbi:hypothetical protein AOQ88_00425 [Candidatus Riesia sp. GBBU]|nr:hypothetical protein AOQ88_00425 [Candidatus Riesia sp. GBBU]
MFEKVELVSPAGSIEKMNYAFAYGADAVYAGHPKYSLRVRNNRFNYKKLIKCIKYAKKIRKNFYITVNVIPRNNKIESFIRDIGPIIRSKPDALIISDPGMIMLVREKFPEVRIHLSVQSNSINWASVKFWERIGVKRVILSRELSIEEIHEIRNKAPSIELEVFIHGSLCMAYSGRCLLSSYISGRDSNQGVCKNICRWKCNKYKEKDTIFYSTMIEDDHGNNEVIDILEDEHGSYILNSKDLQSVRNIKKLISIGVNALKIEGRSKSVYYCSVVTRIYRKSIEDAISNKPFDEKLMQDLSNLSNRGYTEGFLTRRKSFRHQNYCSSISNSRNQFVGKFTGFKIDDLAEVEVRNKFSLHDKLYMLTPKREILIRPKYIINDKKEEIEIVKENGQKIYFSVHCNDDELKFALLIRKS